MKKTDKEAGRNPCSRRRTPQGTDVLQAAQATQDSDKKRKTKGKPIQRAAEAYQPIRGIQTKKSPGRFHSGDSE